MQSLSGPTGLEYAGTSRTSFDSLYAVMRYVQFSEHVTKAWLLSNDRVHAFILFFDEGRGVAIRTGFTSGYSGTGPSCLSLALQVLEAHGVEVEERNVSKKILERLDAALLTTADIKLIQRVRPDHTNWYYYILPRHSKQFEDGSLWQNFPQIMPYAIIDTRITDLALSFFKNPDGSLLAGYRRLEDFIRSRTGIQNIGVKLFTEAFGGTSPKLRWRQVGESERIGRINLFTGAYMAHRNPRGHREPKREYVFRLMTEFLLLNHLFHLEKDTYKTRASKKPKGTPRTL